MPRCFIEGSRLIRTGKRKENKAENLFFRLPNFGSLPTTFFFGLFGQKHQTIGIGGPDFVFKISQISIKPCDRRRYPVKFVHFSFVVHRSDFEQWVDAKKSIKKSSKFSERPCVNGQNLTT